MRVNSTWQNYFWDGDVTCSGNGQRIPKKRKLGGGFALGITGLEWGMSLTLAKTVLNC